MVAAAIRIEEEFIRDMAHIAVSNDHVCGGQPLSYSECIGFPAAEQWMANRKWFKIHGDRAKCAGYRLTADECVRAALIIAERVQHSVNDKVLTSWELSMATNWYHYLHHEWSRLTVKEQHEQPATTAVPDRTTRTAIDENRDLHRQLRISKQEVHRGEVDLEQQRQKMKELERENNRLRARERELVAVYRAMPYADYLKTPHWRTTRAMALERAKDRCQMCNAVQSLQVHHRTYERLGEEAPEDLIALCRPCHAKHHDKLP